MKLPRLLASLLCAAPLLPAAETTAPKSDAAPPAAALAGDSTETYDTLYNHLTVERHGTLVELRARSRRGVFLESAVDLADPLNLQVAYTRTLFAAAYFQSKPARVLMLGLGGAGFHRLFAASYPAAVLQTVELDPKVFELCQTALGFQPTARTPVTLVDGRMFVKRDPATYDWIILDAFRGGYVPPHLKTEEFYRECAARLTDQGVFVSNLDDETALYFSDVRTIQAVFAQVVLFYPEKGNVIAFAVKYQTPVITDPAKWPAEASLNPRFKGKLDLAEVRAQHVPVPEAQVRTAAVLTDDFAPVEFLNVIKANNAEEKP